MSRWVVPIRPTLVAKGVGDEDGALSRIVKYVPAEIVSAYTLLITPMASLNHNPEVQRVAAVGLIILFLFITIIYIMRNTSGDTKKSHLTVSPAAFVAWAYPISSSMLGDWFIPILAFFIQAIVVALSIIIVPREM